MVATRAPSEEDLALVQRLFALFPLIGRLTHDSAQSCDIGSPERARLLFALKGGAARAGWLAQRAKLSPSAISELVEGLEEEGLVRREADPDDRRAVRVVLTAEGRRQMQRFEHAVAAALGDALGDLTPPQRHRIHVALADLREALGRAPNAKEVGGVR